jgi:hypothetical protein
LGILFALILIEFWGVYQLAGHGFWARIIKVKSLQSISVRQLKPRDYYRERISPESWQSILGSKRQYLEALLWTMNRVGKVETNSHLDPVALLKGVEAGEGALCADMVSLYENVLAAIGKPSRKIWVIRNPFALYDTHASIEVWWDGKWVILDPTFGVYFVNCAQARDTGAPLSGQELKEYLFQGRSAEIKPVSAGKVNYPARIEKYYMDYLLLYNNVFVVDRNPNRLSRIPPFCYWWGSKLYYEKIPLESDTHIQFIQQLFFIFAIIIPGIIFVIIIILIGLIKNIRLSCLKTKITHKP